MPRTEVSKYASQLDRTTWKTFDLNSLLPTKWRDAVCRIARTAPPHFLTADAESSREGDPTMKIEVRISDGFTVRQQLPWLYTLYKGLFREYAQLSTREPVSTAEDDRYGAVLHLQRGTSMRFDVHVDTNPLEGLLYVTSHPEGSGGELVIANDPGANCVNDVERDCSIIHPVSGHLIFLDGRRFPHYVRPLKHVHAERVVVAMNFYVPSCPEAARPSDLTPMLFGNAAQV